jgi:Lipocalin-like domain/Thermophilic metalloprotease (M29)
VDRRTFLGASVGALAMTAGEQAHTEAFLGSWDLVSYELVLPSGTVTKLYVDSPSGLIVYHGDGRMSAQLSVCRPATFASDDPFKASDEEAAHGCSTAVVARALTTARTCRLTSDAGTDLTLQICGRTAHEDNGNLREPGSCGNLPAGEAYIAPIETEGDGTIVVDGSLAGYGLLRQPLRLHLHNGRIIDAEGDAADWMLRTLDAGRRGKGRTIAELGIGVNPGAQVSGTVIVDEKARDRPRRVRHKRFLRWCRLSWMGADQSPRLWRASQRTGVLRVGISS